MLKSRSRLHVLSVAAALIVIGLGVAYMLSQSRAEATESAAQSSNQAAAEDSTSKTADEPTSGDETTDNAGSDQQATAADDAESTPRDQSQSDDEAEESEGKAPIPVQVTRIENGRIASYLSASANLVPENQVKVLAEAQGRVAALKVEEGDRVQSGQVLAVLNQDEARIAVNKARVRATNAELAFNRAAETLEQGLISLEAHDRLKMEHEVARQEVAEAEWRLQRTTIRAPFAGRITERLVNLGQHVQPGAELFGVADFNPLIARIYLPERDVLSLQPKRPVRIVLAADNDLAFDGAIRQISPVVDTATGTVKVTIEADSPPAAVRPGAFVTVNIVQEEHHGAVLVPRESVIRELRRAHVFVREGDEAIKREVTLGLEEDQMVEVLSGVDAGDEVIVAGQGGLKQGARIKVL